MAARVEPILGNWYRHLDKGYEFQVVACDDIEGVVDIQHFDGDVESLETDDWNAMPLEIIEPPEDWSGPVDDFESDDTGYSETDLEKDEWSEASGEWRGDRTSREED